MANVDIREGYKDAAWFTANPTLVLKQGQRVNLEQTGTYKLGDGVTQLSSLAFLGSIGGSQTLQDVTDNGANTTNQMQINGVNVATLNDIPSLSGYEQTANKSTDVNTDQASNTKYPSVKAVYDWAIGLFVKKGTITNNTILKGSSTDTATNSSISDDGTDVNFNGDGVNAMVNWLSGSTVRGEINTNNANSRWTFESKNGYDIMMINGTTYVYYSGTNIRLATNNTDVLEITSGQKVNLPLLTASQSVETDANKNLISVYKPFVTPEMYGAVGDGTTDDAIAIQNAINSGLMVIFGAKNYRVNSSLTLSGGKTIVGSGYLSIISTTSNISVFSITGSNNTISNLTVLGNNTGASQNGVSAVGNVGFTLYYLNNIVSECRFNNLGGSGIYATNIIGSSSGNEHEGTYTVNSCIFESCNYGINFAVRGEYNNVNNCAISSCTTGISITGGNNSVNGGKITDCTTGFKLLNGANDGHSVANSVMINHNTTNISSSSLASGYLFEGCMIYAGNLSLLNSAGLYFSSCFFGGSMTITSTSNTNTRFTNCNFVSSFTLTLTGTQPLFNTCKFSTQPSNVLNIGGDKVDISSTSTVVGWSSTTTKLIKYWASGKSLFVSFDIEGTSNSTSTSITIPFGQSGATSTAKVTPIYAVNNGAAIATGGAAQINGVSTTINFFTSMGLGVWTASGTKRIMGLITIELEN